MAVYTKKGLAASRAYRDLVLDDSEQGGYITIDKKSIMSAFYDSFQIF